MAETRYAILIGINDYEIAPLEYCTNDVELINDSLIRYCNLIEENIFQIRSSYNNTVANINASFETALKRIEAKFQIKEDSVFFYFSGHGVKAGNSTAILFKDEIKQLQDIFISFSKLSPRFTFMLIDSCYSGVGIDDAVAKSAEEFHFAQQVAVATGYNIFCASANDKPAKEDSNIKNGRFTHLFSEIVRNKLYYSGGILTLSTVYQQLDEAFKKRPEFRQLPFSQNKGLSTYPLAYLKDEIDNPGYYSNHYIDDVEHYDWNTVMTEIKAYGSVSNDIINEFVRLAREILRNSKKWGKATILRIEIAENCVTLIDNSGNYFDLFNLPEGIKGRGGAITAETFNQHFAYNYEFNLSINDSFVHQRFHFKNLHEDQCKLSIDTQKLMTKLRNGELINIPENCNQFIIEVAQGSLDLSWSSTFLDTIIKSSQKSNVPVIIHLPDNDRLKERFKKALLLFKSDTNKGDVTIE